MRWLRLAALLLACGLVILASSFIYLLSPKTAAETDKIEFVVEKGQTRAKVAQQLAQTNLIRSSFAFFLYSKMTGAAILPGTYELSPSFSASMIAEMLATGKFKRTKITLIEGWRVTQITDYLVTEKKLTQLQDFTAKAAPYEGYLFPDTYEIKVDITTDELIKLLRDNFTKRTAGLTVLPETVILASIVEREAKSDSERAKIAGVYANRIKIGMRLQADPTIQYVKGTWAAITVDDYQRVDSPYNTYLYDGLPPSPICNPGLASIKAALEPAQHDYLFFFHAKGETHFSKTLEEHRAKVRRHF